MHTSNSHPKITIVIPVYNSSDCLGELNNQIVAVMDIQDIEYELFFVDDASLDDSWETIKTLKETNVHIKALRHGRNFGQDNAIFSGLTHAQGEYIVIMDDDLQHDPKTIPLLLQKIENSDADVVFAHFHKKHQRLWKNIGSWLNGKIAEWLLDKPKDIYLSPYKILKFKIAKEITKYTGYEPYIDGLILQITSKFNSIVCEHNSRYAGSSNYSLSKSLKVSLRLVFSFSIKPLKLCMYLGFVICIVGIICTVLLIITKLSRPDLFSESEVGWASLMSSLMTFSGVQILILSIVGEYVARIFLNLYRLPRAIISDKISIDDHPT